MGPTLVANGVPAGAVNTVVTGWVTSLAGLPAGMLNFDSPLTTGTSSSSRTSATAARWTSAASTSPPTTSSPTCSRSRLRRNLNRNVFEKAAGATITNPLTANAAKNRATLTFRWDDQGGAGRPKIRTRYTDAFPVNSGVFNSYNQSTPIRYDQGPGELVRRRRLLHEAPDRPERPVVDQRAEHPRQPRPVVHRRAGCGAFHHHAHLQLLSTTAGQDRSGVGHSAHPASLFFPGVPLPRSRRCPGVFTVVACACSRGHARLVRAGGRPRRRCAGDGPASVPRRRPVIHDPSLDRTTDAAGAVADRHRQRPRQGRCRRALLEGRRSHHAIPRARHRRPDPRRGAGHASHHADDPRDQGTGGRRPRPRVAGAPPC